MRAHDQQKHNFGSFRNTVNLRKTNINIVPRIVLTDNPKPIIPRGRENERNLNDRSINKNEEKSQQQKSNRYNKAHRSKQHRTAYQQQDQIDTTNKAHTGILINVNLQDLTTSRHQPIIAHSHEPRKEEQIVKNQRANFGPAQQPNKSRKKSQIQLMDFQCKEELSYIRRASPGPREKMAYKQINQLKKQTKPNKIEQKPKQRIVDIQQQMKQIQIFSLQIKGIDNEGNTEQLNYFDSVYQIYRINPQYIEQCQPNFTRLMRAFVVQWMMQVTQQFALKRQTFHMSVNFFDRYLQKQKVVNKSVFQMVAAAAMLIASKLQQFQPRKVDQFVLSTGHIMTNLKLKEIQIKVCEKLNYRLHPPTLFRWANLLMSQWDNYINIGYGVLDHPLFTIKPKKYFKQQSHQGYQNYRLLIQLVDCSIMDIQTSQYNPKLLILSFMYLYLGRQYKFFSVKDIVTKFPQSSTYLYEQSFYNALFGEFVEYIFGFTLFDLLPTIQYCATFFIIPRSVPAPSHAKNNSQICEGLTLQEYECFQTFDQNMYTTIKKRLENKKAMLASIMPG